MKKQKVRSNGRLFSTDLLMRKLFTNLYSDFKSDLESESDHRAIRLLDDIPRLRDHNWDPKRMYRNVSTFKRSYQLETLFKRYRFASDKFSTAELEGLTTEKFLQTQARVASPPPRTRRSELVIEAARRHVERILGNFDADEHEAACKFGNRAAVGHPSTRRFLDLKAGGPLTGSAEHISWFKQMIAKEENYLLRDVLVESDKSKDLDDRYVECDALKLTNVAKTFKALRTILANTLLGGFYSYGLGKMVQNRLKVEGLNLRYLQAAHRRWVIRMSKNRKYVTADLSAASDSFGVWLVKALLPPTWFDAFNLGRISRVKIGKTYHDLASFMTMGIGFTFQLQTLLFYSLLRGIQDCLGMDGKISVYGDDLIYPTSLHVYVSQVFSDLGFILNDDKTFVDENFRESCGADAYCGFDVRPFQPEGQSQYLSRVRYVCLLYKTINGLLERWKKNEVPKTLNFLLSEILTIDPFVCQVPPSFPAYAGLRTSVIEGGTSDFPVSSIFFTPSISGRYQNLVFPAYKQIAEKRPVKTMYIYYWDTLRSSSITSFEFDDFEPDAVDLSAPYVEPEYLSDKREALIWERVKCRKWTSTLTGKQYHHKMIAHVATDKYKVVRQFCHAHAWSEALLGDSDS